MAQEETPSLEFLKHPLVWITTLARLGAAIYILVDPFWGLLWSVLLDILDARVLMDLVGVSRAQYHLWDKNVDWFAYGAELTVAASYGVYLPLFLLLFWRFIGHFMYLRTHKKVYFIFFPNFFEMAFMWLVVFHPVTGSIRPWAQEPWGWLVALVVVKEMHEILLHYYWDSHVVAWIERVTGKRLAR